MTLPLLQLCWLSRTISEDDLKALQQLAAKIDVLNEASTHLALRYEEMANSGPRDCVASMSVDPAIAEGIAAAPKTSGSGHFRTLALQQVHASAIAGAKLETSEGSFIRYGESATMPPRFSDGNLASRSHSNSVIS